MIKFFYDRDGDKMERVLNKFYQFVDKIGKQNFILLVFILFVFLVTGIYQTFSLFTSSDGTSVVDGILTYKFILNQAGENAITIAAGSSKNVMVTVSNPDNILLKYGIYYRSSSDLSNVSLGYLKSSAYKGTDVIPAGKDYIVTMKVDNQSSSDVTINLGVSYGLENGGDLLLDTGSHWLDEYCAYKEIIEYLESDGTQYIDTGIYPDQNTKVEFVATPTEADLTAAWFGGRSSYGSNSFVFWQSSNNQMRSDYDTGFDFLSGLTLSSGTQYTVVMDKGSVKVNNTQYLSRSTGNFKSPTSMVFFATKSQSDSSMDASTGVDNRKAKLKFYSAKIYDNGTLVRDFIPVIDHASIPCLYDKVTDTLYYNLNSGADDFNTNLYPSEKYVSRNTEITETYLRNNDSIGSSSVVTDLVIEDSDGNVNSSKLENYDVYQVSYKVDGRKIHQKYIPLPNKEITLTNVLNNSDFESELSDYYNGTAARSNTVKRSGNYSMYITSSTSQAFLIFLYGNVGIKDHKVYIRTYTYRENSELSPLLYVYEASASDTVYDPRTVRVSKYASYAKPLPEWKMISSLTEPTSTNYEYLQFQYSQGNANASGNVYWDDSMAIVMDTSTWDSIPTAVWLDEMVTDFTGSKTFDWKLN